VAAVVIWYSAEEAQVAACSVAYIVQPWHVPEGKAQCSALMQTDIGAYGIAVVALILASYPVRVYSVRNL
jgi:hypothetical protein